MDGLESIARQRYTIGGVTFHMEPLSWQQTKWLGEYIFTSVDLQALDYAVIHDLLRERGPLFMAICLIPEGSDRKAHSLQPFQAIHERAAAFAAELTGMEVAEFGLHFFLCNPPSRLLLLLSGRALVKGISEAVASPAPGGNGSSAVSSFSAMAMSPESPVSSPTGDQLIQIRISSEDSSGSPSSAPSLAGSESHSPG